MNGLRETCHCGHDKSSHHFDRAVVPWIPRDCLCLGCGCKAYVNEFDPKPATIPERPNHTGGCMCSRCKKWRAAVARIGIPEDRPTDPYPWGTS